MKTADTKFGGSSACLKDKRIPFINITNNIGRNLIFKKKLYVDLERLNIITYMNSKTVVTRSGRSAKSITHNLIPRRSGSNFIAVDDNKLKDISNDAVAKEKQSSRRISNTTKEAKTEKVSDAITVAKKTVDSESDVIPINKRTRRRIRIENDLKIDKQIKSNIVPAKTERNVNKKVNLRQKLDKSPKNISIYIVKEDKHIENSSNINLDAIKQTKRNVKVVTRQKLNNSVPIDTLPLNKEAENLDKSQDTNLDAISQVKRNVNKNPIPNKVNLRQKLNNSSKSILIDILPLNKEAGNLDNSPNINLDAIKQVKFLNTSTPLVKRLRIKPAVNFKNNSLNDTIDTSITVNIVSNDKVPIYKRPIIEARTKKKENDVYKFDFAEEKKRDNAELNPYDKDMDNELDAIIKNEQKKVERSKARKRKIAEKKLKDDRKTKKETLVIPKAKKIMDFKDLLVLKNKLLLEKSNSNIKAKQNLPEFNVNISITKSKDNSGGIVVLDHIVINSPRGEDKLLAENKSIFPQVNKSNINSRIASPILDFECTSSNSHIESINTESNTINEPEIELLDFSNNFGFNDDFTSLQSPEANSTMLHLKEVSRKLQKRYPWRPSLIVKSKRYLSTKDSSLPNVEQDLVLNSTIVDRLCYSKINKTVENDKSSEQIDEVKETETTPAKKIVQTSIQSYLITDKSNNNYKDLNVSTLFNDENLSPIKSLNQSKSVKQNSPVRRSILTSLNDNSFFGFNSPAMKKIQERNGILSPKNKPTRIDLSEILLYKQTNQIEDEIDVATEKPTEEVKVPEELQEKTQEKDTLKTLGLFEEFDSTIKKNTQRTYRRKRNRQEPDCQQNDGSFETSAKIKSKKKKKKVDTKFESDADKWAEMFNKMCDDVDKHELHIE